MINNPFAPELETTFKELQQILSSLTEEQLNKVPFPGSWTAGQVGDHLLKSYGVAETLNGRSAKAERPYDEKVEQIKSVFLNFDLKLQSPDFIIPTNDHVNKDELLQNISEKTTIILQAVQTKDPTEICLDFGVPVLGNLTRLEWACFVYCHTQRHINQLKKINHYLSAA
ncbi:MAG TPA: DinB family protein, partial [Chitinophagaceae bacterium]|nr:DinB family protein [Chitinophagaceae bacterium]